MEYKIRIAIGDDHPLFREGVASILKAEPDIEIVGQAPTADEAVQLARETLPDLMLLDIDMPGGGLNAVRSIAATCPFTKIVMLTVSADEEHVVTALKNGARAYILKGIASRDLISVLRTVWAGESYITPSLAAAILSEMTGPKPPEKGPASDNLLDDLTDRERETLELVAEGLSNKEIGQRLRLSEKTVKHYITNILQKLQVRNRVEAALLAQKNKAP